MGLREAVEKLKKSMIADRFSFIEKPSFYFALKERGQQLQEFTVLTFALNPKAKKFGEYITSKVRGKYGETEILFEEILRHDEQGNVISKVYGVTIKPLIRLKISELEDLLVKVVNTIEHEVGNYRMQC